MNDYQNTTAKPSNSVRPRQSGGRRLRSNVALRMVLGLTYIVAGASIAIFAVMAPLVVLAFLDGPIGHIAIPKEVGGDFVFTLSPASLFGVVSAVGGWIGLLVCLLIELHKSNERARWPYVTRI